MKEYTFVTKRGQKPQKRKNESSACNECRRKKKRCDHDGSQETPTNDEGTEIAARISTGRTSHSHDGPQGRFVGDLNPEAALLAEDLSRERNAIGVWIETDPGTREKDGRPGDVTKLPFSAALPDDQDLDTLLNVFFTEINSILPVIPEVSFRSSLANGDVDDLLLHAVAILACKSTTLQPKLYDSRVIQMNSSLRNALATTSSSRDRITLIRTLALTSLHAESVHDIEAGSLYLCQAIHHAHSAGIHLGGRRQPEPDSQRLFWCLWCLDKLNASQLGRPQLMHADDIGLDFETAVKDASPSFALFLRISKNLEQVIKLYRPGSLSLPQDLSTFETLVTAANAWSLESNILLSLEMYHEAVAILSCRQAQTGASPDEQAMIRRRYATTRITQILDRWDVSSLAPLSFVPYSISVATASAYKDFRQGRSSLHRQVALEQVNTCVQSLQKLAPGFPSANTMARHGAKMLDQLRKAQSRRGSEYGQTLRPDTSTVQPVLGAHEVDVHAAQQSPSETQLPPVSVDMSNIPLPEFDFADLATSNDILDPGIFAELDALFEDSTAFEPISIFD